MHCIEYNESYREKWTNFVTMNPQSVLYHDIAWKTILEKTFSLKSYYLVCINDSDEITGILPLFKVDDLLSKRYLISIPFFTNAGICANSKEVVPTLTDKASEIAAFIGVQYVEVRHSTKQSIPGLKSRCVFSSFVMELNSDENIIWKESLYDSVRRNIRKAQRSNLKAFLKPGAEELPDFYNVYAHNMRDLGSPAMPINLFYNILKSFPGRSYILVIKHNRKTIAGMLLILHKKTLYNPFVSSLRKYNLLRPTNLMYWEAITFGCRNKLACFDLGRSTIGTGLFDFKSRWGAHPEPLNYQYLFNKTSLIPICDAINNKYSLGIKLWKQLPLWFTNYIGPKLIRHLPEL